MNGQTIAYVLGFVLIGSFFCYIVYLLFSFVIGKARDERDTYMLSFGGNLDAALKNEFEKFLLGRFAYYDKLSEGKRIKFLIRVRKFIRSKTFEARQELVITEEMEVLVAAGAVQLTFGLKNYILDYFSTIIIYPDSYYSPVTKLYHQGEANPEGVLVVSWKDLLKGYDIPDDTYNVGLHEMAHALELEKRLGGDYDFYFAGYYEKWKKIAEEEYDKVRDEKKSFFRDYAGTNIHEFFAVCVEYFFEDTKDFKAKLPQIYYHLCILLNQDPLNEDNLLTQVHPKSFAEIEPEVLSSAEVLVTRYSYASLFSRATWFPMALTFMACYAKPFSATLLTTGVGLLIIFTIPAVFIFNKIVLYENYIGIKNSFGKLKAAYSLEDIVSVTFEDERNGGSMQVLTVDNGKMHKNSYSYKAQPEDIQGLEKLLADKNVVVR